MVDNLAVVARAILCVCFTLSAFEKARLLQTNGARWHPLILRLPLLHNHAMSAVAVSAIADVMACTSVLFVPSIGAFLCLILLLVYSWAAMAAGIDRDSGCRCLGSVVNVKTIKGFVLRNSTLAALAAITALGSTIR